MIKRICLWLDNINPQQEETSIAIQYGLELLLDNILKLVLILGIGLLFRKGMATVCVLLSFCVLRLQAGGIHAKSNVGCMACMLCIWGISMMGMQYITLSDISLLVFYVVEMFIVFIYAPKTINLDCLSKKCILRKKIYSLGILTCVFLAAWKITYIRELIIIAISLEVIDVGYTDSGIKYTAYAETIKTVSVKNDLDEANPRIVVSKKVRVAVQYSGNVVPPSTYQYSVYDKEYNVEMSGTLDLKSYDYDGVFADSTRAIYEGYVYGHL